MLGYFRLVIEIPDDLKQRTNAELEVWFQEIRASGSADDCYEALDALQEVYDERRGRPVLSGRERCGHADPAGCSLACVET